MNIKELETRLGRTGERSAAVVMALFRSGFMEKHCIRDALVIPHQVQNIEGGWPTHSGPEHSHGSGPASMDDILKVFLLIEEPRDSATIAALERCVLETRNAYKIPAFTVSVLAPMHLLVHPPNSSLVREVIRLLVGAQRTDGGWRCLEPESSDPWDTASYAGKLHL